MHQPEEKGDHMTINGTQISSITGDLTKADYVDAIVNSTNSNMVGHGGLNKAIHKAAGDNLRKACEKLGKCEIGEAKATDAYDLPCKYIIHTVGPVWKDGEHDEIDQLKSCYRSVLETAKGLHIKSIGLSSISTGMHGFPVEKAAETAVSTVVGFVKGNPGVFDKILWIVRDDETKAAYEKEINDYESMESINTLVKLIGVPIEAINWDDKLLYGSYAEKLFPGPDRKILRGLVRIIDPSGKVETIMLPGECIKSGDLYYVGKHVMDDLQRKGIPLCRTIPVEEPWKKEMATELHATYHKLLRQHGYVITTRSIPTDQQRKTILTMLINYDNISPFSIYEHLKSLSFNEAPLHPKVSAKIETDMEYLRNRAHRHPLE